MTREHGLIARAACWLAVLALIAAQAGGGGGGDGPGSTAQLHDQLPAQLATWADPRYRNCTVRVSWRHILEDPSMYSTGGLGRHMVPDVYEVWLCAAQHPCAPAGDELCFAYHEQRYGFVPLALESQLHLHHPPVPNFPKIGLEITCKKGQ